MFRNRPENDETLEALASQLRRLPPPPVPAALEERLLAAIPMRGRARRPRFWLAAVVLLAPAACLLLALRLTSGGLVEPSSKKGGVPVAAASTRAPTLWAYEQALHRPNVDALAVLDRAGPSFSWPVDGPAAALLSKQSAIPLD